MKFIFRRKFLIQSKPDPDAAKARQARIMARFLRHCKADIRRAEWMEAAKAREERRKTGLADADETRKAAAALDAEDMKIGRPATGRYYQLKRPKV